VLALLLMSVLIAGSLKLAINQNCALEINRNTIKDIISYVLLTN
jgi:hypothetical protein